ncbi:MAG: hypothetical protein HOV82_17635 [Streptomyces sp.]|nr:hypothetical protein [Streptomyces sp.]NUR66047.1 hypothetical protein [Streptomyces sp.]NUS23531.1 hypothetical protein [Streptomyces sp.]
MCPGGEGRPRRGGRLPLLPPGRLTYVPAPSHPVHHAKLITELPFPIEIDLDALLDF